MLLVFDVIVEQSTHKECLGFKSRQFQIKYSPVWGHGMGWGVRERRGRENDGQNMDGIFV